MSDESKNSVFLPVISSIQKIRIYETKLVSSLQQLSHEVEWNRSAQKELSRKINIIFFAFRQFIWLEATTKKPDSVFFKYLAPWTWKSTKIQTSMTRRKSEGLSRRSSSTKHFQLTESSALWNFSRAIILSWWQSATKSDLSATTRFIRSRTQQSIESRKMVQSLRTHSKLVTLKCSWTLISVPISISRIRTISPERCNIT